MLRNTRRTRRPRRKGAGFFDAIRSAHDWIKRNKIISTVSGALSGVPGIGNIASAINKGSSALGYGRRRRVGRPRVRLVRRRVLRRPRLILPSGQPVAIRRRVIRPRIIRRRPLVRRRVIGGSLRSMLSAAHGFIKKNQLVSKGLNHFGHSKLASAASSLGYGRRRRPARRTIRHRGGANYFTESQIAVPKF